MAHLTLPGRSHVGFIFVTFALILARPAAAAELVLFDGSTPVSVVPYADGQVPISKAADLLARDLTALTGAAPAVLPAPSPKRGVTIIIGRSDAPAMAALLKANGISAAPLAGEWEAYGRAVVPAPGNPSARALLIFGSDTRGTIWGVVDLSREMGISPWEWWADVTPRRVPKITVSADPIYSKPPTVKYRGFFLNAGHNGLEPWAGKVYAPSEHHLGPTTYARIYELMWRLKANTLWPFMGEFNDNPENYRTAADYAIVRGSSHVEMLLRTNGPEWSDARGPYNWFTNRQGMIDYWSESIRKWGKFDNLYTVGLRDKDDFPMQGVKTPAEVGDALTDVIGAQRKILSENIGRPADQIPQVLTLYKEVLPAYMSGRLKLPDDVTMVWPDDDFGYIRQLGTAREQRRSGGAGVYYHSIFWGPPMSYLWIASSDPSLMWEEMTKAAHFNARNLWILNVGSIKPCEFLTQFFLALAFDADSFRDPSSVQAYLRQWVEESFGPAEAERITAILWRYYKLSFDRNPEFMSWTQIFPESPIKLTEFNPLAYGDENARRVAAFQSLMDAAALIAQRLPADRRAAFFQLVQYPVDIGGDLTLRQLDLDKSIAYGLQHRASANTYSAKALAAHRATKIDTRYYNEQLSGGKWKGWMNSAHQDLPVYETPHVPTWSSGGQVRWGVQVEGGEYIDSPGWWMANLPLFHPELPRRRYIDVFVTAPVAATWTARPSVPWIKIDRAAGSFSPHTGVYEDRIEVSIDWSAAPAGQSLPELGVLHDPIGATGDVVITCSAAPQKYAVHLVIAPRNRVPNVSFIEADRVVSIYARHADARTGEWEVLDGLAHFGVGADIRTPLDLKSVRADDPAAVLAAPSLLYRFATTTANDQATLRAVLLPTFPLTSENGMRLAVSIDGAAPQVLNLDAPEYSEAWRRHALTNEAVGEVGNLRLAPGAHTLRVYALDPGMIFDRFEIAFAGAQPAYTAIPETRILGTALDGKTP